MSGLNLLKVYQLKDIVKQHLNKTNNKEVKRTYITKLKKNDLINFIKKIKLNISDYPDYLKSAPSSKANMNILKKYNTAQNTKEEQEKFLINEEKIKEFPLVPRKEKKENEEPLSLQKHQVDFIKQFIYSNLNGAIMFHGVGSGKTLTAVVCAYWYLKLYPKNKVICISPSALLFNFIEGMRQYGVPIEDNRYTFTTYEKYIRFSKEKKNAKNCLLIVDEAHNLRTEIKIDVITDPDEPTKIIGKDARQNKRAFNILEYGAMNSDKILLLTGTAFVNSIYDIENLLAMVDKRDPILKKTFLDNVMTSASNITDYFSYRISYVPSIPSEFFPEKREELVFLEMTDRMEQIYNYNKNSNDEDDKRNSFFILEKKINNVVNDETLDMNPKIKWCIDKVLENPKQKFIIYTGMYATGIKLMEQQLINNKINYTRITGKESATQKEKNKLLYNAFEYGSKNEELGCRVLLISKAGAEGVDTKNSQNIILLDHQWNDALSEQIIARAVRYKSHFSLPIKERYVNVYRLFLGFKTDKKLFERIKKKDVNFIKLNNEIREAVKEETRLLKKENEEFLPTVKLMKSLKEGTSDELFVPEEDTYKKTIVVYRKKQEMKLYREGWKSYKELKTPEERKRWLIKNYSKWWSLYKSTSETADVSAIDLRLYVLCQAKLENIKYFISYFGDEIIYLFEQYESKLLKEVMEEKKRLGKDGLTDKEENDIYDRLFKNDKEEIKKIFFENRKRTTKERLQQYFTNPEYAQTLINSSNISNRTDEYIRILEPTAGDGSLIAPLMKLTNVNFKIDMIELDDDNRKILSEMAKGRPILNLCDHKNFLTYTSGAVYDYIFTNPPFHLRKNENNLIKDVYDYDFILRSYAMLKPGGHLHAIIGKDWYDNTPLANQPDDNDLLLDIKQITTFKKQKDSVKFSNVQVSNTYFIHIKKPMNSNPLIDDAILKIKYYKNNDALIGEEIEQGEISLKEAVLNNENLEKIKNYVEEPIKKKSIKNIDDSIFIL